MDIQFVRDRIAFLRTEKGISARELSLRLGQSTGYISQIETGKSNPSVEMLIYICEELGISMSAFFDDTQAYPIMVEELVKQAKGLNKNALESVLCVMRNLHK